MVLPTKKMRSSLTPARRRFSLANSLVVKNQFVMASVTMRLISSGMVQSPERMPPSTWATGMHEFLGGDGAGHGRGDVAHHQAQSDWAAPAAGARSGP